jgi:hypothetical protein
MENIRLFFGNFDDLSILMEKLQLKIVKLTKLAYTPKFAAVFPVHCLFLVLQPKITACFPVSAVSPAISLLVGSS